jgi:hypothetical protein
VKLRAVIANDILRFFFPFSFHPHSRIPAPRRPPVGTPMNSSDFDQGCMTRPNATRREVGGGGDFHPRGRNVAKFP